MTAAETKLMERCVHYTCARINGPIRQDCEQEARLAFFLSSVRYDARSPRCGLSGFAQRRMRGAVNDYLRHEDPLSRSDRSKVNAGQLTPPTFEVFTEVPVESDVDASIHWNELVAFARPRERIAIRMRFFEGREVKEIGNALGVGPARASQIVISGLMRIRARIGKAPHAAQA